MKRFLILALLLLPLSAFAQNNFRADTIKVIMIAPQSGSDTLALRGRVIVRGIFLPDSIYSAHYGGVPEAVGGVIGGLRDSVVFLYTEALTNSATSGTLLWLDGDTLKPVTVNGPIQFVNGELTINKQMSVSADGLGLKLLNDEPTPTSGKAYAVINGVKGWYLVGLTGQTNLWTFSQTFYEDINIGSQEENRAFLHLSNTDEAGLGTWIGEYSLTGAGGDTLYPPQRIGGYDTVMTQKDTLRPWFFTQSEGNAKVRQSEIYTLPYQIGLGSSGLVAGTVWPIGRVNGETVDTVGVQVVGPPDFTWNIYFGFVTGTATDSLFSSPPGDTADAIYNAGFRNSGILPKGRFAWFKSTTVDAAGTVCITIKGHR